MLGFCTTLTLEPVRNNAVPSCWSAGKASLLKWRTLWQPSMLPCLRRSCTSGMPHCSRASVNHLMLTTRPRTTSNRSADHSLFPMYQVVMASYQCVELSQLVTDVLSCYTCAGNTRRLTSHEQLHTLDCKALNESLGKYSMFVCV